MVRRSDDRGWFTDGFNVANAVATGDEVESVQGIFSGTMSFLFNTWDGESAFSETVAMAKAAGYTEPDPREDLNGLDVARKVVIAPRHVA